HLNLLRIADEFAASGNDAQRQNQRTDGSARGQQDPLCVKELGLRRGIRTGCENNVKHDAKEGPQKLFRGPYICLATANEWIRADYSGSSSNSTSSSHSSSSSQSSSSSHSSSSHSSSSSQSSSSSSHSSSSQPSSSPSSSSS